MMATKVVKTVTCDFCGGPVSSGSLPHGVLTLNAGCNGGGASNSYDICHECLRSFEEWTTSRKVK